jgi:hypothetical protein
METIVTIVIVLVMALWVGWSFYRMLTGKAGCDCSGSSCSSNDNCAQSSENNAKN